MLNLIFQPTCQKKKMQFSSIKIRKKKIYIFFQNFMSYSLMIKQKNCFLYFFRISFVFVDNMQFVIDREFKSLQD